MYLEIKILNLFNIQRFTIKEDDRVISELFSTHDGGLEYKEDGSLRDIAYMSVALDKDAIAKIKTIIIESILIYLFKT